MNRQVELVRSHSAWMRLWIRGFGYRHVDHRDQLAPFVVAFVDRVNAEEKHTDRKAY